MSCCAQRANGASSGADSCATPICINTTTTNATVQTINIGTLAAVGAGITFVLTLEGTQDNGERGLFFGPRGNAARNAIGSNVFTTLAVGPVGYTDTLLVPWTTLGVPVGWTAAVGLAATVLQLTFNGAAGQTVHWRGQIDRWAHNGATLA